jgi:hypothetical protein
MLQQALSQVPSRLKPTLVPVVAGILLAALWISLAVGLSLTRAPWSGEAWTAIPAVNLATQGSMRTTVLEFKNTWLQGLDRHTYWLMPLHLLAQAGWYKLVGFSLLRQRLLSVLFALILLASWSRIVLRLTGMRTAAFAVCVIIGFEDNFMHGAANGRMDMMCAALGSAAIAVWLELRGTAPRLAFFAAHALAAAAVLTHPCGVLFAAALLLVSLSMSGWRIRPADLLISAIPYVIGAALWGLYIAQAPADFYSQFFGNISGFAGEYLRRTRFNGLASPWRAIQAEILLRYLMPFRWDALGTPLGPQSAVWLLITSAAAPATLLIPALRAQRGVRVLFLCGLLVFLLMALFEGMKFQHYLIYSLPFLAALAATTGGWLWLNYRKTRVLLIAGLLVLTLPQIRFARGAILLNPLRNQLAPATDYLRANMYAGASVIGPAELGYQLGFNNALRDDVRLGYYSGLRPQFIVTSGWYRLWFDAAATRDPAIHAYIERLLQRDYRQVLASGEYQVYRRTAP